MKKGHYSARVIGRLFCLFLLAFYSFQTDVCSAPADYHDTVQQLYIGYYQRPADPAGLAWWAGRLDEAGGNLNAVIEPFAASKESRDLYGGINYSNIAAVINNIYNAFFGREAEASGFQWWVDQFNSGAVTPATIMLSILNGARNEDLQSINNKRAAANLFTGTVTTLQADYSGNADAYAARGLLALVTSDPASVPNESTVTQFVQNNIIDQSTVAKSQLARSTAPGASDSEINTLVKGNTAFALDLYQAIRHSDGNLFYSPYSISLALTLAYAGARTETEKEMASVLRYGLSQERLHPTFNGLGLVLKSREEDTSDTGGSAFRLNIANAIWGEKTHTFLQSYLDVLAVNYGAGLRLLDFINAPDTSRITVNDWVAHETEDRIKDLIPEGAIDTSTRLVLTNAIYFNASWLWPFEKWGTSPGVFSLSTGEVVTTDFMARTEYFRYASDSGYAAVELPYSGRKLAMLLLVPDKGRFQEFEAQLTPEKVNNIISSLAAVAKVRLRMPKFTFAGELTLSGILKQMGMATAFSDQADFSGMDGKRDLSISDVLHKAWVKVNEEGTEAAAATADIIEACIAVPILNLTIDRPFIFLIRDIPTGSILFVGRVVNPLNEP